MESKKSFPRRKRERVVVHPAHPTEPQQQNAAPPNDDVNAAAPPAPVEDFIQASPVVAAILPPPPIDDVVQDPLIVAEEAPPVVVGSDPLPVNPAPVLAVVPPPAVDFQEMWEQIEARVQERTRERITDIVLRATAEAMEEFQNAPW
jgi:hypothetical protein